MPSSPTIAVFDLGGVLIDWNPRHLYRKLFPEDEAGMEHFLAHICTQPWNERQDGGRPYHEAEAELIALHPEKADLIRAYHARWDEMLGGAIQGTVDILADLRGRGTPLFALTNWSAETFHHAERRFEFLTWFKDILVSGREGLIKPDPRIFRLMTDRFGIAPGTAAYIDDVPRNVAAGEAAGLKGLLFTDPPRLRRDLETLGLL